eukprot:2870534-Rhodomonas_salina.2
MRARLKACTRASSSAGAARSSYLMSPDRFRNARRNVGDARRAREERREIAEKGDGGERTRRRAWLRGEGRWPRRSCWRTATRCPTAAALARESDPCPPQLCTARQHAAALAPLFLAPPPAQRAAPSPRAASCSGPARTLGPVA